MVSSSGGGSFRMDGRGKVETAVEEEHDYRPVFKPSIVTKVFHLQEILHYILTDATLPGFPIRCSTGMRQAGRTPFLPVAAKR